MGLEDDLASGILALGGVEEHLGPRGPYFAVGARTIAYIAAPGLVEIRLPARVIDDLRAALEASGRAILRRRGSRWVGVRLVRSSDVRLAVDLARRARDATRGEMKGRRPGP